MTLILTVNSPKTIWMLADTRLSSSGKAPKEDGRKLMILEATDGVAILGYAGIGATIGGTEPSDWMNAVLRGRNLPLEQLFGVIADAMQREFPKHLRLFPKGHAIGHNIVIPCFAYEEVRLYTIDMALSADRKNYAFRYTRHIVDPNSDRLQRTPRLGVAGSGLTCLVQDKRWIRELIRLVRACDLGKVTPHVVADRLANINQVAHENTPDGSVGPKCVVAWRHSKRGIAVHELGGGQQFYDGTTRVGDLFSFPLMYQGRDMMAFFEVIVPHLMTQMPILGFGETAKELDRTLLSADIANLPEHPDEKLN